jgi:HK97 family phage major capsid protein
MTLAQLRKALKEKQEALSALETKATAAEASDEDVAALDTALNDIEKMEKRIATLDRSEKSRAAAAKAATDELSDEEDEVEDEPATVRSPTASKKDLEPRSLLKFIVAGSVKAYADNGVKPNQKQVMKAIEDAGFGGIAKHLHSLSSKNLNTTTNPTGGFLVPYGLSSELIPLLYKKAKFKTSGPKLVPMPDGRFEQRGVATSTTAGYRAEGASPMISHATFRPIDMKAKLLAGMTSLTDQQMRWSFTQIGDWATNNLETETTLVYDYHCFLGAGGANVPLGIFNIPGIPAAVPATGGAAPTVQQVETLLRQMEAVQENVNMDVATSGYVMSYRTYNWLKDLRLPNSDLHAFPELRLATPTFNNKKLTVTMQVPNNLGVGTNESFIGLVNWPTVLDGETFSMRVKSSDVASYNSGGTVINAFADGVTLIRAEMEHDVEIQYSQTVVKSGPITWGA